MTEKEYNPEEPLKDPQYEEFCELVGYHGMLQQQAYGRAVAKTSKNVKTWAAQSTLIIRNHNLKPRIAWWREKKKEDRLARAFQVEEYLEDYLQTDINSIFNYDGETLTLVDGMKIKDLPPWVSKYIQGIKAGPNGVEITFMSKSAASQQLIQAQGDKADSIHQVHILGTSELGEDL